MPRMGSRERRRDAGRRNGLALKQRLLGGTRELRIRAGLSQLSVSSELGISPAAYGRLERGEISDIGLVHAAEVAAVLGARLSVQLFPVGLPIRDAGQVALLDRFMRQVPRIWNPVREAPMPIASDLRAWDLLLRGPVRIGIEAETRPADLQAEEREIHLKQRDSGVELRDPPGCGNEAKPRARAEAAPNPSCQLPAGNSRDASCAASRAGSRSGRTDPPLIVHSPAAQRVYGPTFRQEVTPRAAAQPSDGYEIALGDRFRPSVGRYARAAGSPGVMALGRCGARVGGRVVG